MRIWARTSWQGYRILALLVDGLIRELYHEPIDKEVRILLLTDVEAKIDQNSILGLTQFLQCRVGGVEFGNCEGKGGRQSRLSGGEDENEEDTDAASGKSMARTSGDSHFARVDQLSSERQ